METRILTVARSVSTALLTVLAAMGVEYPMWHWVPVAAGVVSLINLNIIPAATAALAPTPAVQVQLTPAVQAQQPPKQPSQPGASS